MTDRQRNTLVVGCIIFGILALGSVGTGIIVTALGQTGNTARTRTVRSNRTEKAASQQQSSNEIQTKVFEEKERIEEKNNKNMRISTCLTGINLWKRWRQAILLILINMQRQLKGRQRKFWMIFPM